MAITEKNLMRHNHDWDWVDEYAARMGDAALVAYSRKLFAYLHALPDNTTIVIRDIVRAENEDLFAKCVCRYIYEGTLNLQFSTDFTRLRKDELKPKENI